MPPGRVRNAGAGCRPVSRPTARTVARSRRRASSLKTREAELERDKTRLAAEGRKEQQTKIKEMEKKLETVLRDFEYQARETISAIQDRAMAQKLTKDAERRISKLRREFRDQFDSTVVAHTTGADQGDPNAQPQVVKHVSEGDTVKLKSVGRPALVTRRLDDNHFEVEIGVMKMKIARDDIAEVLVHAGDSPVKAARARGFRFRWKKKMRTSLRRSTLSAAPLTTPPRSGKICRSRIPGRPASGSRRARQWYGDFEESAAAIFAEASTRGIGHRASAE